MGIVDDYLGEPVPPGSTPLFKEWKERWSALLNADDAPRLLQALEDGSEAEQHTALIGLRLFLGYDAWGIGFGAEYHYRITLPNRAKTLTIVPKVLPLTLG